MGVNRGSDSYIFLLKGIVLCICMEEVQLTFTSLHCFLFIIQTIFVFVKMLLV